MPPHKPLKPHRKPPKLPSKNLASSRGRGMVGNKNHIFHPPGGGGRFGDQDYTSFIQWTPLKIVIFGAGITIPYIAIVTAIGVVLGFAAAVPLIILAVCAGAIATVLYGISRL
jgi:hypothetical protein